MQKKGELSIDLRQGGSLARRSRMALSWRGPTLSSMPPAHVRSAAGRDGEEAASTLDLTSALCLLTRQLEDRSWRLVHAVAHDPPLFHSRCYDLLRPTRGSSKRLSVARNVVSISDPDSSIPSASYLGIPCLPLATPSTTSHPIPPAPCSPTSRPSLSTQSTTHSELTRPPLHNSGINPPSTKEELNTHNVNQRTAYIRPAGRQTVTCCRCMLARS